MRLFVFARHGQSVLNVERRVNGDPSLDVPLTSEGVETARALGRRVANVPFDVCIHTRFTRTRETALLALANRDVPFVEEPLLDDIKLGDLEGWTTDDYRAWKAEHTRRDRFPGGESLDDAARRYARALEHLLERPETPLLVVTHEIPLRYAINAADGSDDLDGPTHQLANATPYLFDAAALERAITHIRRLA